MGPAGPPGPKGDQGVPGLSDPVYGQANGLRILVIDRTHGPEDAEAKIRRGLCDLGESSIRSINYQHAMNGGNTAGHAVFITYSTQQLPSAIGPASTIDVKIAGSTNGENSATVAINTALQALGDKPVRSMQYQYALNGGNWIGHYVLIVYPS